jgi:hypothetical protein
MQFLAGKFQHRSLRSRINLQPNGKLAARPSAHECHWDFFRLSALRHHSAISAWLQHLLIDALLRLPNLSTFETTFMPIF